MVSGTVFVIGGRLEKRLPKRSAQIAEAGVQTAIAEASVQAEPVEAMAPKAEEAAPLSMRAKFIVDVVLASFIAMQMAVYFCSITVI